MIKAAPVFTAIAAKGIIGLGIDRALLGDGIGPAIVADLAITKNKVGDKGHVQLGHGGIGRAVVRCVDLLEIFGAGAGKDCCQYDER
ncbi:MAG TPA: hypothetical protein VGM63_21250 [Mucilaginibacter sp.]